MGDTEKNDGHLKIKDVMADEVLTGKAVGGTTTPDPVPGRIINDVMAAQAEKDRKTLASSRINEHHDASFFDKIRALFFKKKDTSSYLSKRDGFGSRDEADRKRSQVRPQGPRGR